MPVNGSSYMCKDTARLHHPSACWTDPTCTGWVVHVHVHWWIVEGYTDWSYMYSGGLCVVGVPVCVPFYTHLPQSTRGPVCVPFYNPATEYMQGQSVYPSTHTCHNPPEYM